MVFKTELRKLACTTSMLSLCIFCSHFIVFWYLVYYYCVVPTFDTCPQCGKPMVSHGQYKTKTRPEGVPRFYCRRCHCTRSKREAKLLTERLTTEPARQTGAGPSQLADKQIVRVLALLGYGLSLRDAADKGKVSVPTVRKIQAWFHEVAGDPENFKDICRVLVSRFKMPERDVRWRLRDLWSRLEIAQPKAMSTRSKNVGDCFSKHREFHRFFPPSRRILDRLTVPSRRR
jgi:hypothetical protein